MPLFFLFSLQLICPLQAQWIQDLPADVQSSILWSGDHEEGTLNDWTLEQYQYPGGGIFNTGGTEVEAVADATFAHSGTWSVRATITNAWQAQNGSRAVRLMRWTDTAWDNGGQYFPKTTYYSAFFYFPYTFNPNKYPPWDPGDGGWWNIFQFKSDDENEESQPVWTLNVEHDDAAQEMSLYLYTKENVPNSYGQNSPIAIPIGEWVHLEALYVASDPNTANGQISIFQNGELILNVNNIITTLESGVVVWGIGNYTDHIAGDPVPGTASIYLDDAIVSSKPIHPYVSCNGIEQINWIGMGNGNTWHDPENWSLGYVPLDCQKVIIPASQTVGIEANKIVNIKNLELEDGAILNVAGSSKINILGN